MVAVALVAAVAIVAASFYYLTRQEQRYRDLLEGQTIEDLVFLEVEMAPEAGRGAQNGPKNEARDTLAFQPGPKTVVLFWASWSDRSISELENLIRWHGMFSHYRVIAAVVKDGPEFSELWPASDSGSFYLVDGTPAYQDLRVPGVPSTILFGSDGHMNRTAVGSQSEPLWHRFQKPQPASPR